MEKYGSGIVCLNFQIVYIHKIRESENFNLMFIIVKVVENQVNFS